MIKTELIHTCHVCGSCQIEKNGRDYKGQPKFHCLTCGRYGTLNPKQRYSESEKETILQAYQERMSMRGIQRVFGVAYRTLKGWLLEQDQKNPALVDTLDEARPEDVLELDELWSFVYRKSNQQWVWIVLCRRTRQVVAFYVGDHSDESCRRLWEQVPQAYKRCHSYRDFWQAYQRVMDAQTHQSVGKETGETAHVERWNNTLRQRLARFVRKTLSFSKSELMHKLVLRLFIIRYNLQRRQALS